MDHLENKIRRWIRATKVCVRTLFASEKKLCEQIFDGVGTSIDDACFVETVKGVAVQLFNFAEFISINRRSLEKLFKILDLHDALTELMSDIDVVFDSKSFETIRVQAAEGIYNSCNVEAKLSIAFLLFSSSSLEFSNSMISLFFSLLIMLEGIYSKGIVVDNVRYGPRLRGKKLTDDEVHKMLAMADYLAGSLPSPQDVWLWSHGPR
ncbi:hypothetical protein V8G54_030164 [Vigna mungo]|uniref:Exocyst subunit Exo70 family protein n=1 Tax=Vigna mungo TaxID=3915 RepID=A0AAQ3RJU4_VIGMU